MNQILYKEKEFLATDIKLPCFIHGHDGSGASQFTISLVANLVAHGAKVLFFCARTQGKDSLLAELKDYDLDGVLIADPGDEQAFLDKVSHRVEEFDCIIIKNIEEYSRELLTVAANIQNLILSGNFDSIKYPEIISPAETQVFFSSSENFELPKPFPELEKYEGYMLSKTARGKVTLEIR